MPLVTELYTEQKKLWPKCGRHILAQFDNDTIIVYQAYSPALGNFAVTHGNLGGEFSYSRMSWVKPNFLWMMYRCGWATKPGQERVLAIRMLRSGFEEALSMASLSHSDPGVYADHEAWRQHKAISPVRVQWDPERSLRGAALNHWTTSGGGLTSGTSKRL